MKKIIEEAAAKNRLQTAYSGATRIMYLKGDDETIREFIRQSRITYPNLAFELKNGNQVEEFNEIAAKELKAAPPESHFVKDSPELPVQSTSYKEVVEEKKKPTPQEVDDYLLAHPVNRTEKGPYNGAAAHFGVKPDYIRGRWARLRELGKVEIALKLEKE